MQHSVKSPVVYKREGRESDYEILTCRLVDPVLPSFIPLIIYKASYQTLSFSADGVDMPVDALVGLVRFSSTSAVPDIPFNDYFVLRVLMVKPVIKSRLFDQLES